MEEEQYQEILKRLSRIEEMVEPLREETGYLRKISANFLGSWLWEWSHYFTRNTGIHPPQL